MESRDYIPAVTLFRMPRWWNKVRGFMGKRTRKWKKAIIRRFASSAPTAVPKPLSMAARVFAVDSRRFSIEKRKGWRYQEAHIQPTQGHRKFTPSVSPLPHLVLRDVQGVPRFTLSYRVRDEEIQIDEIQRCHTAKWVSPAEHPDDHARRETLSSKTFQSRLGGVYPPEFLLVHFLSMHRDEILSGKKLTWKWGVYGDFFPSHNMPNQLYPALAKHYFKRTHAIRHNATLDYISTWELDLGKLRTREALGLSPSKKKK